MGKLKVINLFGAPCSGKSTVAAGLFSILKRRYKNVELVTEFAKDLVWDENYGELNDQLLVLATQNHRLMRLQGKVEWVITDSPLMLNLIYGVLKFKDFETFREMVNMVIDQYENTNIFLERNFPYDPVGRSRDEEMNNDRADQIEHMLAMQSKQMYHRYKVDWYTADKITELLFGSATSIHGKFATEIGGD